MVAPRFASACFRVGDRQLGVSARIALGHDRRPRDTTPEEREH
jgi:hypothetical protein